MWNFVATDLNPGVLVQSIIVKSEIIFLTFETVWVAGSISADDLFMNLRKKIIYDCKCGIKCKILPIPKTESQNFSLYFIHKLLS